MNRIARQYKFFLYLAIFLFFVAFTFPYKNLKGMIFSKIYSATQIYLMAEEFYPTFLGWPGVVLKNASVTLPFGSGEIDLAAKRVVARIGLGGLFPPAPLLSLSISSLKGGGDLYLSFTQSSAATAVEVESEGVELKQIEFPGFPEPISGKLDLVGNFTIDTKDVSRSTGEMFLEGKKIRIPAQNLQGVIFPVLPLGETKVKMGIKNGLAEIHEFQFGEKSSDFQGKVTGDLKLAQNWMGSFLNTTVKIQLSPAFIQNPQSATIVSFLESFKLDSPTSNSGNPTNYGMKWSASLAEMTTNVDAVIPKKAE